MFASEDDATHLSFSIYCSNKKEVDGPNLPYGRALK